MPLCMSSSMVQEVSTVVLIGSVCCSGTLGSLATMTYTLNAQTSKWRLKGSKMLITLVRY